MIRRSFTIAVALAILASAPFASAQDGIPTDLARALTSVKEQLEQVAAATDEASAQAVQKLPELEGFTLEKKEEWVAALRLRQATLQKWEDGRAFRRSLPESVEAAARQQAEAQAQFEREQPRETGWLEWREPTEQDVRDRKTTYETIRTEYVQAERDLARAKERRTAIRSEEPRRELERIRAPGAEFDAATATPLAKFNEQTRRIDEARLLERLDKETDGLLSAFVDSTQAQRDFMRLREQKAGEDLAAARTRFDAIRDTEVKEKREAADQLEKEARAEEDVVRRYVLRRNAAVARQEAEIIVDARDIEEIQAVRERESGINARMTAALERLRKRYGSGDRSTTGAAASLLSALGRARTGRVAIRTQDLPRISERLRDFERRRDTTQDLVWDLELPADELPAEWLELRDAIIGDRAPDENGVQAQLASAMRAYDRFATVLLSKVEERLDKIELALTDLREIESLYFARVDVHDSTEAFVLRRILWLRTADPIGLATIEGAVEEAKQGVGIFGGRRMRARLADSFERDRTAFVLGGLAIIGLTAFSFWLVRRLRGFRTGWHYRGGPALAVAQKIGMTIVVSALAPGALALATLALEIPDLPAEVVAPARTLLLGIAIIFFGRRFIGSMLREDGLARTELGADPEVADQLLRASRRLWTIALLAILPYVVLVAEPFRFVHIPTVIAVVALLLLALLINGLIRPRGPLVRSLTGGSGFWHQSWAIVSPFVRLGVLAIPVMFALGYQEGAKLLVVNVGQTIAAALVLISLYSLLTRIIEATARRVRARQLSEQDETARERSREVTAQLTRVLGLAVVVIAIWVLSGFWGFDEQVGALLDAVEFATVDAESGLVLTLKDVILALLWIAAVHFVIRNLPGIFEATLFTRIKADQGTRFVIQTIARYVIFVFGYSAAILSLHVDFQNIAWIFAGASIGIGFGLQEIVSNFVSGLILLLERPIRVGDVIAVGSSEGTVKRINIRSTELESFDRLVLVVPNRRFISEDVVNWTRNDAIRRMTRNVGITYAEDIPRAIAAIQTAFQNVPNVLREPKPEALVSEFADSSVNLKVRFFVRIEGGLRTQSDLLAEIHAEFGRQGIEIPFPQRDLHVRSIEQTAVFRTGTARSEPSTDAALLDAGDTIGDQDTDGR